MTVLPRKVTVAEYVVTVLNLNPSVCFRFHGVQLLFDDLVEQCV